TKTWASDTADRPHTSSGYVYDGLGRTLTLPAADSAGGQDVALGYYDTDAVRSIGSNGATQTFNLDPAGRRASATTTGTAGTRVMARHYTDSSDNPAWVTETLPGAAPEVTRYAESIGGDLGATITDTETSLTLGNLHGDTVTTITLPAQGNAVAIGGWADWPKGRHPHGRRSRLPSLGDALPQPTVANVDSMVISGAAPEEACDLRRFRCRVHSSRHFDSDSLTFVFIVPT
ncbi:MAG: hypothetical protein ACRDVZ_05870, partial [Jiangellaceae bacterium]